MQTKWLLKAAFADKLPTQVAERGKQGFSVPVSLWLRRELRDWSAELLMENRSLDVWFRPAAVRQMFEEHVSGKINHGKRLWALLMFALWQEQHAGVMAV
jgi:asparagine synthase (glutamine-hydrolysing)